MSQATVRRFQPADREAIRGICCATGFLGEPIDPVFEDRELFADYLTSYYTDREPESSFVVEIDGKVRGYLLGSRLPFRQQRHSLFNNFRLLVRGAVRYLRYNDESKRFVRWILLNAWREIPAAPRSTPHFHFNVLPDARDFGTARKLVETFFDHLRAHGERRVYGQIVVFEDRRGAKLFERFGFTVMNRKEITKFRHVYPERVSLCTVVKELSNAPQPR